GRRPAGLTAPNSTSAIARPPSSPGHQACRSAEVYTNGGELKYIELEMLGPLRVMKPSDELTQINRYTLGRRTVKEPAVEARKIAGW
ncbi:MAG: hypothetical protein Q7U75_13725, partial [Desulfobacterales bacterium]|nr:hypothetical protein [Desulfobacterales bacterium]